MDPVVLFVASAVALLLFLFLVQVVRSRLAPGTYVRKPTLLTATELEFLAALTAALGPEFRIFVQVRLADFVAVGPSWRSQEAVRAFNRIACKSIDFLVCDQDCRVLAAIELNDRSHGRSDRRQRDDFLRQVFAQIDLPLVEYPARRSYDPDQIREELARLPVFS